LVSAYIWRGIPQDVAFPKGTPNIQPSINGTIHSFSLGIWGSGNFNGTIKEIDLYAGYQFNDYFSLTLTDYNWTFNKSYFNYGKETDHVLEATANYEGGANLPLTASLNTIWYGADKQSDGDQAYSTYVELSYTLAPPCVVTIGAVMNESPLYQTGSAAITNIALKASKDITISSTCHLPVFVSAGYNPTVHVPFLVAGISL